MLPAACLRRAGAGLGIALLGVLLAGPAVAADAVFAAVRPGAPPSLPRDHGSHPAFRTEWWYVDIKDITLFSRNKNEDDDY